MVPRKFESCPIRWVTGYCSGKMLGDPSQEEVT